MPSCSLSTFLVGFATSCGGVAGQVTHVVGPGGFAQIRDALVVAAANDCIDVHPGWYAHFEVTVGVTVRALTAGTVSIAFDPVYFPPPGCGGGLLCAGSTRFDVPTGQEAHVQGLVFLPSIHVVGSTTVKHNVFVAGGRATFDDCEFGAHDLAAFSCVGGDVRLVRCRVFGQPSQFAAPVVSLLDSTMSAVDCRFEHLGGLFNLPTAAAVRLENSLLVGSRLYVRGPSMAGSVGGRAIDAISGAFWISDSTLQSGPNACAFTGANLGTIARCIVNHGSGGTCANPVVAPLVGVETFGPVAAGTTYSLAFRGQANGIVAVFATPFLGHVTLPGVQQPILVDPATAFAAGLALFDAGGGALLSWAIPPAPAIIGLPIWFQGLGGAGPLLLSPVAGGLVR